jgi:hypothetical protein
MTGALFRVASARTVASVRAVAPVERWPFGSTKTASSLARLVL